MPHEWFHCRLRLDGHFGTKRWLTTRHQFWRLVEEGGYECERVRPINLEVELRRQLGTPTGLGRFVMQDEVRWELRIEYWIHEQHLLEQVMAAVQAGRLVVVREKGEPALDPAAKARAEARRISDEIGRLSRGRLLCDGRGYSIHAAGCFDRGEIGMTRQIVPPSEAPKILERLVRQHANQPPLVAFFQKASSILSATIKSRDQEPDLVLLRHLRAPGQQVGSNEPAMTPSQLRAAMSATLDITLVDLDGHPREGVAFEITGPDGNITKGNLDKDGGGHARSSYPGVFTVTFPELDGADWDGDGVLELPPETRRTEIKRHPVAQGERMATIARQYGFENWQTIWAFRGNETLNDLRKKPAGADAWR